MTSDPRPVARPRLPMLVVAAAAVLSALVLLQLSRPLWFLGDDWDFLLQRRLSGGDAWNQLMRPHNEHWSLVPILEFRTLYTVFGLRYLPYAAVTIACHVVVVLLAYVVLRRYGGATWPSVVAACVLAFAGAAAEDLLWGFQIGFLLPLALGLLALLVLESRRLAEREPVQVGLTWVLLTLSLMCSGTGITVVCWVAAVVWLRRGLLRGGVVAAVPGVVYLAWYVRYGRDAVQHDSAPWARLPPAVAQGAASVWEKVLPVPHLGGLMIVLLVVAALYSSADRRLTDLARAGLLSLVVFLGLIAFTRVRISGVDAAVESRYVYIGMVLTLPALVIGLTTVSSRLPADRGRLVAVAVVLLFVLPGAAGFARYQQARLQAIGNLREGIVAAADLARSGRPLLGTQFSPANPNIATSDLVRPDVRRRLPSLTPGPQARLDVVSTLQVAVAPTEFSVTDPPSDLTYDGAGTTQTSGPCVAGYSSSGRLRFDVGDAGGQVRITAAGRSLTTQVRRGARQSLVSSHVIAAGQPVWVATSASGVRVEVTLPDGPFTACTE